MTPEVCRYVIVDFPVFVAIACLRWRLALAALVSMAFYVQLFFLALPVAGYGVF